jgi:hypothetical protein
LSNGFAAFEHIDERLTIMVFHRAFFPDVWLILGNCEVILLLGTVQRVKELPANLSTDTSSGYLAASARDSSSNGSPSSKLPVMWTDAFTVKPGDFPLDEFFKVVYSYGGAL